MNAPHVMLVNGSLFGGGAEHVIGTLARHLRAAGHRVTIAVVHRGGEVKVELEREGFDVVTELAHRPGSGSSASHLGRLIADRGVDVVHSHDIRSLIDAGLCRLRTGRVVHVHTFHFGNYPHAPWKNLAMEAVFARVPDQLVAVGHGQRASLIRSLWLRESRVRTIWNGVDYDGSPADGDMNTGDRPPRIGSISTFGEQKGISTLLQAAKLVRDRGLAFRLVLVGEGAMRRDLEAMASALGLEADVEFTGWKPDAPRTQLPTFDVFVQSSYWEAMSVVILEAMAARRAIVATTVGENPLVLTHDESAILVPPRDPRALANGLARALVDPTLRRRLAAAAHSTYAERFTGRAMAERYASAYRDCLRGRRVAGAMGAVEHRT